MKKPSKKSKKPVKVVYNACFGGFSLSRKAANRLAELGDKEMAKRLASPPGMPLFENCYHSYLPRHDHRLVQVMEELGDEASGHFASLHIETLKGRKYRIEEYDGRESVVEPDDVDWIVVE